MRVILSYQDEFLDELYSELGEKYERELSSLQYSHGIEDVIARLVEITRTPDGLTTLERERFQMRLIVFRRALEPDYRPPRRSHSPDVTPLSYRYHTCYENVQFDEAEKALWGYLQHCSFGTVMFQDALGDFVHYALERDNLPLARHLACLMLHHFAVVNILRYNSLMKPGFSEPYETVREPEYEQHTFRLFDLPYWDAITALETDDAQCWVDILEITAERTPLQDRAEYFYPKVLEALRQHYRRTGNLGRLEWIKAYDPE